MTASSGPQAVQNGRAVHRYDQGYCQKYVRDPCWRVGSLYGSAIEAWNGARDKHPGDRTPPEGAPCYYRGGSYGHAVISVGGGRIRSTDCTSATYVNNANLAWPERAWGYEYLGWTGDINGVVLPLAGTPEEEDDMPLTKEDIDKIAQAVWAYMVPVYGDNVPEGEEQKARVTLAQTHNRAGEARYYANEARKNTS